MKIGVIGVGSMGQNHARVLSRMGILAAVMDTEEGNAKEIGERFDVPFYSDIDSFLELDLDGVTIATPAHTHKKVCDIAIENGLNVLIEKPISLNISEAEEMVKYAEDQGVVFSVGMIERHNPVVSSTKKFLKEGNVGDIITISSRRVSSFPTRVSDMGVIMDLAIHDIDVMRYLLEDDIVSVYSLGGVSGGNSGYEDHANIMLNFSNGVNGVVEVNWLTPHKVRTLSITCSNDYVEMDYIDQSLVVTSSELMDFDTSNLFDIPLENNIRRFSVKRKEPLKKEMEDFVEAIKGEHEPLVRGRDALKSMYVTHAAIESLKKGKEIEL